MTRVHAVPGGQVESGGHGWGRGGSLLWHRHALLLSLPRVCLPIAHQGAGGLVCSLASYPLVVAPCKGGAAAGTTGCGVRRMTRLYHLQNSLRTVPGPAVLCVHVNS